MEKWSLIGFESRIRCTLKVDWGFNWAKAGLLLSICKPLLYSLGMVLVLRLIYQSWFCLNKIILLNYSGLLNTMRHWHVYALWLCLDLSMMYLMYHGECMFLQFWWFVPDFCRIIFECPYKIILFPVGNWFCLHVLLYLCWWHMQAIHLSSYQSLLYLM